jgi:hypothetical protein
VRLSGLPADLAGLAWLLVAWALWGARPALRGGVLYGELADDGWPSRGWYAVTIGHVVLFGAGCAGRESFWRHEMAHVHQAEAAGVSAALAALTLWAMGCSSSVVVVTWCGGYFVALAGGWLAAVLSGGDPRYDSAHEQAAYAIEEMSTVGEDSRG